MFTGIIQHVGEVRAARPVGGGRRVTIDLGPLAEGLQLGDSVAVSGACLTACAIRGALVDFDVAGETVARTTLGEARPGTKVNLERPLRVGDALDGHLVQGHVDGVAEVSRIDRAADQWAIKLAAPRELTDEMVAKGSVAVAGVSLTLTHVADGSFAVALIPTTLSKTTFADLAVGAKVNIETDVLGKYIRRYLRQMAGAEGAGGGLTLEKLRDAGFV
jgi:riboflavin synthase